MNRRAPLVVSSALALLIGCAAPASGDGSNATSAEVALTSAIVTSTFTPAALAHERATMRVDVETRVGRAYVSAFASATSDAVGYGAIYPGQIVDIEATPRAHVLGVYRGNARVGEVRTKVNATSSFAVRARGDFTIVCEDCEQPVIDFEALGGWEDRHFDEATTGWSAAQLTVRVSVVGETVHCGAGWPGSSGFCDAPVPAPNLL